MIDISEREQAEREEYIKAFIDAYIVALKTFNKEGENDNDS